MSEQPALLKLGLRLDPPHGPDHACWTCKRLLRALREDTVDRLRRTDDPGR